MTTRPSWSPGPAGGRHAGENPALLNRARPDETPAPEVIGVMAGLLRDTRGTMLLGGIVLSAATIGIALEAAFSGRAVRPGAAGAVNAALLCGLLSCWLRAAVLLALAGRPVLTTLSELRWRTGAPLDPRARWLTLPAAHTCPDEWTWTRAHLLLGAARLSRYRTQLAGTWAFITAIYFLVWTAIVFLGLLGDFFLGFQGPGKNRATPQLPASRPDGSSPEPVPAMTCLPQQDCYNDDTATPGMGSGHGS